MKRAIIIVLDGVGIGELPDAAEYGDEGSNTLGNIAKNIDNFRLPNLEKLGLGNIDNIIGFLKNPLPEGCFGKMAEKSPGKDTTTGHWEIAGIVLDRPFPVYPAGFPDFLIEEFEIAIKRKTLGNIPASGTEIINRLGKEHLNTGYPIVYTSGDSVFQIAAHEDIIPVEELYNICKVARKMLKGEHAVGRVIARPFIGSEGNFTRTVRRRDFSLKPPQKTLLDYIVEKGYKVKTVGKIDDIFTNQGVTESIHTQGNVDGINKTINFINEEFPGLIFTNLIDYDMLYGHRNDINGFAQALIEFDERLPKILNNLKDSDILFITADHGCDPTTLSTDHSREYVPLLVYGKKIATGRNLGIRKTFADLGATIAEYLNTGFTGEGISFYNLLKL
ncbi:MAG TPA: phosphopentomutase [Clostridiaceae bacterium]|nr:phosphopentomutase [Clostridiaceae bacterium]